MALSPLVPQSRIPRAGFISLCRYLLHQVAICILLRPRRQQLPRALRAAAQTFLFYPLCPSPSSPRESSSPSIRQSPSPLVHLHEADSPAPKSHRQAPAPICSASRRAAPALDGRCLRMKDRRPIWLPPALSNGLISNGQPYRLRRYAARPPSIAVVDPPRTRLPRGGWADVEVLKTAKD